MDNLIIVLSSAIQIFIKKLVFHLISKNELRLSEELCFVHSNEDLVVKSTRVIFLLIIV